VIQSNLTTCGLEKIDFRLNSPEQNVCAGFYCRAAIHDYAINIFSGSGAISLSTINSQPLVASKSDEDGSTSFLTESLGQTPTPPLQPSGGKWWRYRYRFAGKQKLLALGVYPDVSLSHAREKHAQARKALAAGNDPGAVKREVKRLAVLNSEATFEAIAKEWCDSKKHKWVTNYYEAMMVRLQNHIFPRLGSRPITEINAQEFLSVVRVVEKSGALDLAQRLMQASAARPLSRRVPRRNASRMSMMRAVDGGLPNYY
jgi:hypothetical protein